MTQYFIQIKPSNGLLVVNAGETVLEAALRAGYEIPYSCGSATCGTCMGKVISGTFTYGNIEPYALDDSAREEGFALFCSVQPTSDMVIELEDAYAPGYIPISKNDYAVVSHQLLPNDIYQIVLKTTKKPIRYHAGQHIKILGANDEWLPFSIANAPNAENTIELHIKRNSQNTAIEALLTKITTNQLLTLRGPYGNMVLQSAVDLPIILVAGGTGIVPLKALVEQLLEQGDTRPISLYWGARDRHDLYCEESFTQLAAQYPQFKFIPVINTSNDTWQGEQGIVHEIVLRNHNDFSDAQVYASGPTEMVYACLDAFTEKGLRPQLFYSDTLSYFPRNS